jgi:hypothetical protein
MRKIIHTKMKIASMEFFDVWAEYRLNKLLQHSEEFEEIVKYATFLKGRNTLPEWNNQWFMVKTTTNENDKTFSKENIYNSWDQFLKERSKIIKKFINSGHLDKFEMIGPFDDSEIVADDGVYKMLKNDCDDLIRVIKNYSHATDKQVFFLTVEEVNSEILFRWAYLNGRYDIKWQLRQAKSNSGIGQKKAQEKRLVKLIESLQQYNQNDNNEINIKKGDFCKLLDSTFDGSEDYPRHHSTIKAYKEKAEVLMKKNINLLRRGEKVPLCVKKTP